MIYLNMAVGFLIVQLVEDFTFWFPVKLYKKGELYSTSSNFFIEN